MNKITLILDKCNVVKHICCHVLGPNHTSTHRALAGTITLLIGFLIVHTPISNSYIHSTCEIVGWSFHGLGLHPIIEKFKSSENEKS